MVKVTILDLNTGRFTYLEGKEGSTQYFFEPIFTIINNVMYEICLRIDPEDPSSKLPVLDAQMWEMHYGHRWGDEIPLNKSIHHTHRKDGSYHFKFVSVEKHFILYMSVGMIFDAILAPSHTGFTFDTSLTRKS